MTALQIWLENHNRRLTQAAIDEALMEYIAHIEKRRDELLDAIKDAYHVMTTDPAFPYSYHVTARKLGNIIRKAEGAAK